MGKPLRDAAIEVGKSADFLKFYASTARFAQGEVVADARDGVAVTTTRQPLGVCRAHYAVERSVAHSLP